MIHPHAPKLLSFFFLFFFFFFFFGGGVGGGGGLVYMDTYMYMYTDHAGPEISVNSRITSTFSRQIAMGNAGPILALESM